MGESHARARCHSVRCFGVPLARALPIGGAVAGPWALVTGGWMTKVGGVAAEIVLPAAGIDNVAAFSSTVRIAPADSLLSSAIKLSSVAKVARLIGRAGF